MALVVVEAQRVEAAVTRFFPKLGKGRDYGSTAKSSSGYAEGMRAGHGIALNRGVGSDNGSAALPPGA